MRDSASPADEEGAASHGLQAALEAAEARERISHPPEPPGGTSPADTWLLTRETRSWLLTSRHSKNKSVLFLATKLVLTCHSSEKKGKERDTGSSPTTRPPPAVGRYLVLRALPRLPGSGGAPLASIVPDALGPPCFQPASLQLLGNKHTPRSVRSWRVASGPCTPYPSLGPKDSPQRPEPSLKGQCPGKGKTGHMQTPRAHGQAAWIPSPELGTSGWEAAPEKLESSGPALGGYAQSAGPAPALQQALSHGKTQPRRHCGALGRRSRLQQYWT